MKALIYTAIAAMAISLAACSNNEDEPADNSGEDVAAKITGIIDGAISRAYDTHWEENDHIGISTTSNGKTRYVNKQYQNTGSGAFAHANGAASGIFFQDTEPVTFSAYYPFSGNDGMAAGELTTSTDTQTKANQKNIDYLYASGATASRSSSTVNFSFSHKMTRLILKITTDTDAGFTAEEVKSGTFYLNGIKHNGTFNTATGDAGATGDANNNWQIPTGMEKDVDNTRTYSMIFYPQTDAALTFKVIISEIAYTCQLNPALESGHSYTYNIAVKKTGLTVGSCTITDWTPVTEQNGTAEMQ